MASSKPLEKVTETANTEAGTHPPTPPRIEWNLADLFEQTAEAIPDRMALSWPEGSRTYAELHTRSWKIGAALRSDHLPGAPASARSHVAVLSWNRVEWLEAMIGCYAAQLAPVNLNYRYVDEEVLYLLENSDSVAVIIEPEFLPMIRRLREQLPLLSRVIVMDPSPEQPEATNTGELAAELTLDSTAGESSWSDALAVDSRLPGTRSPDDPYLLYTGGTTGMPKGVMWRSEDIYLGAIAGIPAPATPGDLITNMPPHRTPWLVTSPLMHGNGQWNSMRALIAGSGVSLWTARKFDADAVIDQAVRDKAFLVVLVGDAMARPFADALAKRHDSGDVPDLSNTVALASGGAILSPVVKQELARLLPNVRVVDGFGASESGGNGSLVGPSAEGAPRFKMSDSSAVLDDDLNPTVPGDGVMGRLARTGHIPIGYYKDEAKTAATFPTGPDGRRWAIPGDAARWEEDGTIAVFGRGSNCINTGGEKVFPEEVEATIKAHPEIENAFVLGRPDDRFGQRVAAVIARRPGSEATLDDVRDFGRTKLASYKLPREAVFVDELQFTGPGKPDYKWARSQFDDPS